MRTTISLDTSFRHKDFSSKSRVVVDKLIYVGSLLLSRELHNPLPFFLTAA